MISGYNRKNIKPNEMVLGYSGEKQETNKNKMRKMMTIIHDCCTIEV